MGIADKTNSRDEPPILAVGGAVYRRTAAGQLELLLIKKRNGFWTLPKGRIKPGEDEHDAVVREVVEETGICGEVEMPVRQVAYKIQKAGRRQRKQVTYYLMRAVDGRLQPDAHEHIIHVRWFPLDVAQRRIRRKRVRAVVQDARTRLESEPAQE